MGPLTVADLMTPSPYCVHADDTLATAWDWMENERVRHLPVVDEDGNLEGVLSHRDLLRHALAGLEDVPMNQVVKYLERRSVRSAMVTEAEHADPSERVEQAAERMLENKWGCLPVCEGHRVVGILTESDFVRHVLLKHRGDA